MPRNGFGTRVKAVDSGETIRGENPLAIVEVAKELRNIGIAFKWFVVGDGVLRQKLQNKIDEYQLAEQCVFYAEARVIHINT